MAVAAVTFTVLPWGRSDSRLWAGILVSPRLPVDNPSATLADFPDFVSWPQADFRLTGLQTSAGDFLPTVSAVPESPDRELWAQLLPPQTPVAPFEIEELTPPFLTYAAGPIADFLRTQWRTFARGPARPTVDDLLDNTAFGTLAPPWAPGDEQPESLHRRARRRPGPGEAEPGSIARSILHLLRFHIPYITPGRNGEVPDLKPPILDFHAVLGALTSHPWLLQRLGLLWRLELEPAVDLPDGSTVRVEVEWSPIDSALAIIQPWTAVAPGATGFAAAAADPSGGLETGLLPLGNSQRWSVETVDIDAAGLQIAQLADSLRRQRAHPDPYLPRTTGLPALRSAGLTLRRNDNAQHVAAAHQVGLERNAALTDALASGGEPPDLLLTAEDLFRGVRVDVCDTGNGKWRSLTGRRAALRVPPDGPPQEGGEDEGATVTAVASNPSGAGGARLAETVAHWDGWSLVAARPGAALPAEGAHAGPPLPLTVDYTVPPGSLPKLRYGHVYQLRARTVDLGGGGLSLGQADSLMAPEGTSPDAVSAPIPYGRFDPVPPPVLLPVEPFQPGDAVERLVARTDANTGSTQPAERVVAAPGVAQLTAERHGMFDVPPDQLAALYAAYQEAPVSETPPGPPAKADLVTATIWPLRELQVPWSRDPMASAAALLWLPDEPIGAEVFADLAAPGEPSTLAETSFSAGSPWPVTQAFRLRLSAVGETDPPQIEWVERDRTLHVLMPWASRTRLRLACALPDVAALEQFGVWQWMTGLEPNAAAARAGFWWALTPHRSVELVSAVRSPLRPPLLADPMDDKKPYLLARRPEGNPGLGMVHADITGAVSVDAKSTGSVEIVAEWEEWLDDGNNPPSVPSDPASRRITRAQVLRLDVPSGPQLGTERTMVALPDPATKHVFGDTRARALTYIGIGFSRFADCFPATGPSAATPLTTPPEGQAVFGLPSTARPHAATVQMVVPYFTWTTEEIDGSTVRRVRSGGLRVWLDRPWWSSGAGEQLGVVFDSSPADDADERIRPYLTTWAPDPARPSRPTGAPIFPRAAAVASGLHLAEAPLNAPPVMVAAHNVDWDANRGAWFTDIEVRDLPTNPENPYSYPYAPFVRLAIARYQPSSLPTTELSAVTVTDPVQLPVHRSAEIRRDFTEVQVSLNGLRMASAGLAEIGIQVAKKVPRGTPDELAWTLVGEMVPLGGAHSTSDHTEVPGYHGGMTVPNVPADSVQRLVIREYETFWPDPSLPDGPGRRLIYADAVALH